MNLAIGTGKAVPKVKKKKKFLHWVACLIQHPSLRQPPFTRR